MNNKRVIITSGGTGGHIFPALVLGEKLSKEGVDVLFLGDKKLLSYIGNRNLPFEYISSGQSLINIKSVFKICVGTIRSLFLISKFKPSVVFGFGCYATLPVLTASTILKKTIFIHEQNSHIGKINRFFSSKAKFIFTSFYEMYGINIKDSQKIEFTGNLIRNDIKKLYNLEYRYPSANEKFHILITGGSGGASFFSTKFINIFKHFPADLRERIFLTQQVKQAEEINQVEDFYSQLSIKCEVKEFFTDMPQKIKEAHLVISRSGIGIASELAAAGKPTIFIPSPSVANNHQFHNADFYRKNNACILFEEQSFNEKIVSDTIIDLIQNQNKLESLSKNIRNFAHLDAEDKIYNFIVEEFN